MYSIYLYVITLRDGKLQSLFGRFGRDLLSISSKLKKNSPSNYFSIHQNQI